MTVTNEKRREVAENLREQLRYMRKNNSYDEDVNVVDCGNSAYRNIAGSVEPYGNLTKIRGKSARMEFIFLLQKKKH